MLRVCLGDSSMRLGVPFIAPRQLGAVGGNKEGQSCLLSGGAPDSPVHHRTTTVHVRCVISFLFWRRRPLQIHGSWRTGHYPVPPADRWRGHASPTDCAADCCASGHWLTGQSDAPPDSPVNYSRTPPNFPESVLFTEGWPGAPDTIRCARLSRDLAAPSQVFWFFSFLYF
jgi:hypothetical protein